MLKIGKKVNNYRSKKGTIVFVYEVKGNEKTLAEYNTFKEEQGFEKGLFHSTSPLESGTPIELNFAGDRYIAKSDLEQEFEKQQQRQANANAYVALFGRSVSRSVVVEDDVKEEVN